MKPALWACPFPPLAQTQCIYKLQLRAISREASSALSQPTSSFRLLGREAGRTHSAESDGEEALCPSQKHHHLIFPDVEQMLVTKTDLPISEERLIQWREKDSGRLKLSRSVRKLVAPSGKLFCDPAAITAILCCQHLCPLPDSTMPPRADLP